MIFALLIFGGCGADINSEKSGISAPKVSGKLEISFLKAGKADAIVIKTENKFAVIDCGEKGDGKKILEYADQYGTDTVDVLFITHFDKDHVGGAAKVINGLNVKKIITPDYEAESDEYKNYEAAAAEKNITPDKLTEKESFVLDDVLFEVYPPEKKVYSEGDNDYSLAISITHGETGFLFTGDAEAERTEEIIQTVDGRYDLLKIPHHGRYNKNTEALVKAVMPKYSVICDSEKNYAEDDTLKILEEYGSKIYHTADGTVSVISDGKNIKINQ